MTFYIKNELLSGYLNEIDLKIQNLADTGSLHSPSSLIFTFRLKFLAYKSSILLSTSTNT